MAQQIQEYLFLFCFLPVVQVHTLTFNFPCSDDEAVHMLSCKYKWET